MAIRAEGGIITNPSLAIIGRGDSLPTVIPLVRGKGGDAMVVVNLDETIMGEKSLGRIIKALEKTRGY